MERTATGRVHLLTRVVVCMGLVGLFAGRATAGQFGFVYALQQVDGGANQIHGFRIDETTGVLTPLPGFPMSSGGTGGPSTVSEQLAYRDGRLYVVNDGTDTLTVFVVNRSTGALTATPFSPVALGAGSWRCVDVHPTGSPVVVGNASAAIASFVVTSVSATAAAGSPFSTGTAAPFSCRFAQGGTHVYTGGNTGNFIAGFSVNAGTGVLTPLAGSPFDSGAGNPTAFASDNSGRLFSASFAVAQVRVFTTSGGTLTGATGNPFAAGLTSGTQGVLHPGGFYMVAHRSGGAVGVFQIVGSGSATTLTAIGGSPFSTGGTTTAITLTPDGTRLVAANGNNRNLSVFSVNPTSGVLSGVSTQPTNTLGTTGTISGLVFAPGEAGFVYSLTEVNGGANQIYGYRINPNTGGLTLLPGFPVATGGTGTTLAASEQIAHHNGRLYVLNDNSDTMSVFKVNRTTGALTALPFSPMAIPAGSQSCVAVHPSGSPVVVGNGGTVNSFNIGATTGSLAPGNPLAAASFSCTFSKDGNYFYAGGNFGSAISGFGVNAGTGALTELSGSPFDSGDVAPASYATDSAGRLFTASVDSPAELRAFTTAAGIPTSVSGNPFSAGGATIPAHGILHPGGFYMLAARTSNGVGVFKIAGAVAATTLSTVFGSPFTTGGSFTTALALTTNGTYLVAANATSRNLTVFQVNPATGSLSIVVQQTLNTLGAAGRVSGLAFAATMPPFFDDPLTAIPPLSRVIKTIHITELRARVDAVRAQYGFAPYAYTDPTLTAATTIIQVAHISDLRAALAEVYTAAGIAPPSYTDPALSSGTIVVKAAHIMELRSAVIALE
jgi:6-phosphogluconolactonase